MTTWIRSHRYTLLAVALLAGVAAWLAVTAQPWWHWLLAAAYAAVCAWRAIMTSGRQSRADEPPWPWPVRGRGLPCPPACHIQLPHRHDRAPQPPQGWQ